MKQAHRLLWSQKGLAPPTFAQISLGTSQSFAVLGNSTVTNSGPSAITGVVGEGTTHANDATARQAHFFFSAMHPLHAAGVTRKLSYGHMVESA